MARESHELPMLWSAQIICIDTPGRHLHWTTSPRCSSTMSSSFLHEYNADSAPHSQGARHYRRIPIFGPDERACAVWERVRSVLHWCHLYRLECQTGAYRGSGRRNVPGDPVLFAHRHVPGLGGASALVSRSTDQRQNLRRLVTGAQLCAPGLPAGPLHLPGHDDQPTGAPTDRLRHLRHRRDSPGRVRPAWGQAAVEGTAGTPGGEPTHEQHSGRHSRWPISVCEHRWSWPGVSTTVSW